MRTLCLSLALGLAAPALAAQTLAAVLPGPSTAAASQHEARVAAGLEVFASAGLRVTNTDAAGATTAPQLDLGRLHLAVDARGPSLHARAVIEGVRSAGEGSLVGIAGDALVLRAREAYAGFERGPVELRAGIVATLTVPEIEATWRLRAVAATPLEASSLAAPSDLGVSARVALPRRLGWVGAMVSNGEGYSAREFNTNKRVELAASVHPSAHGRLAPLAVLVSASAGTTGVAGSRNDRVHGALLWQGVGLRGGVSFTHGWGVDDDSARRAWLAEAFVRAVWAARFIAGLRVSRWQRDTAVDADRITSWVATVGARLDEGLELYLAMLRAVPGGRAYTALPGSDHWDLRLVARAVF